MVNFKEIQDFVRAIAKSGVSEVEIKTGDFKLVVKVTPKTKTQLGHTETTFIPNVQLGNQMPPVSQMQMGPTLQAAVTTTTPVEYTEKQKDDEKKYLTIKSPMVGTFYRRPSPDKPYYVNPGDEITQGKVICIIEAMKLFNEIESEVSGKIVKILVEDSSPVEYDQPLFLIEP